MATFRDKGKKFPVRLASKPRRRSAVLGTRAQASASAVGLAVSESLKKSLLAGILPGDGFALDCILRQTVCCEPARSPMCGE
jgi:hypothetical protein